MFPESKSGLTSSSSIFRCNQVYLHQDAGSQLQTTLVDSSVLIVACFRFCIDTADISEGKKEIWSLICFLFMRFCNLKAGSTVSLLKEV
jgi:hypothetical protein